MQTHTIYCPYAVNLYKVTHDQKFYFIFAYMVMAKKLSELTQGLLCYILPRKTDNKKKTLLLMQYMEYIIRYSLVICYEHTCVSVFLLGPSYWRLFRNLNLDYGYDWHSFCPGNYFAPSDFGDSTLESHQKMSEFWTFLQNYV